MSDQQCSSRGRAVRQKKQPGPRWTCSCPAVVLSSISALLHFNCQNLILQLGAAWRKGGHRRRQPDVPPQRSHLNHQFIALLEETDFALDREGQPQTHLVMAVLLAKGVWRLHTSNRGRIFFRGV